MELEENEKEITLCDECRSEYYSHTSEMTNLCPECSHILYGYKNCHHEFVNNRCEKCFWNGNTSEYLKRIK
jgi:predicted RNA-binding Zn-ribbon protein involved in translation (DUF1610 family)